MPFPTPLPLPLPLLLPFPSLPFLSPSPSLPLPSLPFPSPPLPLDKFILRISQYGNLYSVIYHYMLIMLDAQLVTPIFSQVYQGPNTKFEYKSLPDSTEVRFRVCALRLMNAPDQYPSPIKGAFSPVISARTMSPRKKISETEGAPDDLVPKVKVPINVTLTDKQWAMVFFSAFSLLVVLVVLLLPCLFGVSD